MSRHCRLATAILLASLALLLPFRAARADMAPPQPPLGSGIVPGQETTQVRMLAETVLIELPSSSPSANWQAAVSATFTMRNLGSASESMQARFPMFMTYEYLGVEAGCPGPDTHYPAVQNFRALVEGKPVAVKIDEVAMSHYENNQQSTVKKPCWANFPVTFPPDQDVQVEVRYQIQGQLFGHGITNYLGFPYILTTGRGWQGTIGSAEITVRLPYPVNALNTMEISAGGQVSGNEVRWHFTDFEPESNTVVWVFLQPGHLAGAAARRESGPGQFPGRGSLGADREGLQAGLPVYRRPQPPAGRSRGGAVPAQPGGLPEERGAATQRRGLALRLRRPAVRDGPLEI